MKTALSSLTSERERLKQCVDHETIPPTSPKVFGMKNALATVREVTHTEMLSVSISQVFFLSNTPQKPRPPTPLVRCDTSLSLLEGLLAVSVMSAHLNMTMFNSHVSCGCLPPGGSIYFLFHGYTFIVMLTSFTTLELLCSLRQRISLTLKCPAGC